MSRKGIIQILPMIWVLFFVTALHAHLQTAQASYNQQMRHSFHDGFQNETIKIYPSINDIRNYTVPALRSEVRRKGFQWGKPAFVRIFKAENTLELWLMRGGHYGGRYELFKSYEICKFSGQLGPKFREGDKQAPEGFYTVGADQLNPNSRFYLSFNIGFPNAFDRAHGRKGTALMVHGGCESQGCYAMTNAQMAEIYMIVEASIKQSRQDVPVHIFPFHMTEDNMQRHQANAHYKFWRDLQVGYDYFEFYRTPPRIAVQNGRYLIEPRRDGATTTYASNYGPAPRSYRD